MRNWLPRFNNSEPNRQLGCLLYRVFNLPPNRGGCVFIYAFNTKFHHQPNQNNFNNLFYFPNPNIINYRHNITFVYKKLLTCLFGYIL